MFRQQGTARLVLGLIGLLAFTTVVACGDDGQNGAADPPPPAELCQDLDDVRDDLDTARQAVQNGDRAKADDALEDARTHLADLRSKVRSGQRNEAAAQSAGDLVGALDGLQTTLRQAGQGGDSIQGVAQELEIQLPAIVSSLMSLRSELGCS
jgi:hypothetical protein